MTIVANAPRPYGLSLRKISATQATITGTGGVTTGLSSIVTGGASATVTNCATSATWSGASITSISGGTVNVAVCFITYSSSPNAILNTASNTVAVIAIGA